MQQSLSNELRGVIEKRLHAASPGQVLAIASALCAEELPVEISFPLINEKPARFDVQGDMVLDRRTGLTWSRENVGGGRKSWSDAKKAAQECTLGGHTDWRLPTIRELLSIVDYERHNPAIDPVFVCNADWYWSSTPLNSSPGVYAWLVGFGDGGSYWVNQSSSGFVRAVRPG